MTERGIDCSGLVHISFRAAGRLVPRDADQQEDAGTPVDELEPGDLISYGDQDAAADHVAFWLGEGRILHATGRDGVNRVLEEPEPEELRRRRRRAFRL
jgi:cell wall-associated NlpC family hydrolase